jgi:molecular chaperone HscB
MSPLPQNFFQLFNLPETFALDLARLEANYHALQSQAHPDKHAHLPAAQQRAAMQQAAHINEAHQTLRNPLTRARYLLMLHGVDTQEETNTAMPTDFLMQQMSWREAITDAQHSRDEANLQQLEQQLQHEMIELQHQIAVKIDTMHDYAAAAEPVRKLKFMEKLAEQIASAYDALDN